MAKMAEYLSYWGKAQPASTGDHTWHPAAYHGLDVAAVGQVLLNSKPQLLTVLPVQSCPVMESVSLIPLCGRPYGTDTSRQRIHERLPLMINIRSDDARSASCNTAIEGCGQGASRPLWAQSQDGCQMEETRFRPRRCDGTERSAFDRPDSGRRGSCGRLSPLHAVTARRLPLCVAGNNPAVDAIFFASLVPAPRHQPFARS